MTPRRIAGPLAALLLAALIAGLALHLVPMPSLAGLRAREHALAAYGAQHPVRLAGLFAIFVVVFTALPLPGAELLTIAAGALFGLVAGTVLVSFASTIGACGAFAMGRWWLRDAARRHLTAPLGAFMRGVEREGAFYLFALRMIPAFPFFIINVLMGVTSLRLATFYWVSQIGMLPATIAYVNAGRELGGLHSLSGIVSPGMLASFAVIGLLPLAARRLVAVLRRRSGRIAG
jgi:uncharacterized membrane protein YdjX (TVP38/TMEM64 family)